MAILDLRRRDQRSNIRENPFWITSAEILPAADDAEALLFSFPAHLGNYFIHEVVMDIKTAFDGSGVIDVGYGTIATDAVTTLGTMDNQVDTHFMATAEITEGTIGLYPGGLVTITYTEGTSGVISGTVWAMAKILGATDFSGTGDGDPQKLLIKGVDADVPCVYATLTGGTITTGAARLQMLVSKLP